MLVIRLWTREMVRSELDRMILRGLDKNYDTCSNILKRIISLNRILVKDNYKRNWYIMDEFTHILGRIGENIKELRKQNQWTQVELAERTKRPQSSIARVESATYGDASLSLLYDLCHSLGISLSEILAISEGKEIRQRKVKLTTTWERVRAKVDRMSETDRAWVADIILAVLRERDK